jgi:hypothetical protein
VGSVLLVLLLAKFEIVSASAKSFTYRELVPPRVAADAAAGLYHARRCPDVKPHMPWIAPAAATLRKLAPHSCAVRLDPELITRTEARKPRDPNVISLLFLGNSLVYFNQIPAMTQAIAAKEKRPLRVEAVTRSGITLEQLRNDTEAPRTLWIEQWDYVVVQGGAGSSNPLHNAANFHQHLALWADDIRRSGAEPLFYSTWRDAGKPGEYLAASTAAAQRAGMRIVPAGNAWYDLVARKRFQRLDWDGTHPDAFGAYLVACSVYSTIYGKPAHGAPFDFRHLASRTEQSDAALRTQIVTAGDARAIQDAAWNAVRARSVVAPPDVRPSRTPQSAAQRNP